MNPIGQIRSRIRRVSAAVLAVVGLIVGLLIGSFAIPIRVWRTGELPAPPLDVVEGGPAVVFPRRIWIDTDAACGHSRTTDPDDCLALLLLARARSVEIVGISTVYGNAPLAVTDRTTRDLVATLEHEGAEVGAVYLGADHAIRVRDPDAATPARAALREALEKGPLTVVALGPLTNIAAALADRRELQRNVARVIAVMGRRPGHLFHPAEGSGHGMLFGHGPVFRDFNFDQDRNAAAHILGINVPLTLVPYVAARQVSLTGADLAPLEAQGGSAAWIASRSRDWLKFWQEDIGRDGFYPFDVLAAVYALSPTQLSCAETKAWVGRDERLWGWLYGPEALLVRAGRQWISNAKAQGFVLYCPETDPAVHEWIMSRVESAPDPHRRGRRTALARGRSG